METEVNLKVGKFSASRISELLAGGTGKTAQCYCLDLASQMIGISKDIQTNAMLHGIANQRTAFDVCIKPKYPEAIWFDEYLPINDYCGASPDFASSELVGDIKCPHSIYSYAQQIDSMPKKYYQQVQMQMMATGVDLGLLCFYLTKQDEWGADEWIEYPFGLEERHKIFEIKTDEEVQDNILFAVDKYQPVKMNLVDCLTDAEVIEENEMFYDMLKGVKYKRLKEAGNIVSIANKGLIRVKDEFFYKSKL